MPELRQAKSLKFTGVLTLITIKKSFITAAQSGLSQKQYCEQNNIRYYVFHFWNKRYKDNTTLADNKDFVPSSSAILDGWLLVFL